MVAAGLTTRPASRCLVLQMLIQLRVQHTLGESLLDLIDQPRGEHLLRLGILRSSSTMSFLDLVPGKEDISTECVKRTTLMVMCQVCR